MSKRVKKKTAAKATRNSTGGANPLWGGRFAAGPDALMEKVNASIGFDKELATQDLAQSRAH